MKKLLTLISLVLLCGMTAAMAQNFTSKKFKGSQITGVEVQGIFEVNIRQDSATGAVVSIPKEYKENLVFELSDDGILKIGFKGRVNMDWGDLRGKDMKFTAEIACTTLEKLTAQGMTSVTVEGKITTSKLEATAEGMSKITTTEMLVLANDMSLTVNGMSKMDMNAKVTGDTRVCVNGMSKLSLSGSTKNYNYEVNGMSSLESKDFISSGNVNGSTAGMSRANVASAN